MTPSSIHDGKNRMQNATFIVEESHNEVGMVTSLKIGKYDVPVAVATWIENFYRHTIFVTGLDWHIELQSRYGRPGQFQGNVGIVETTQELIEPLSIEECLGLVDNTRSRLLAAQSICRPLS